MSREYSIMRFGKPGNQINLCLERKIRKNGYAGFATSRNSREHIYIVVNEGLLNELGIRNGYITSNKDGTLPRIIMRAAVFNGFKQGKLSDRFLVFHEIAHYCCGHLRQQSELTEENTRREALTAQCLVSEDELEADRLAAEYLGAEAAVSALQEAMEQRMAYDIFYGSVDDPISPAALTEYQLRIDAINEHFDLYEYEEDDK